MEFYNPLYLLLLGFLPLLVLWYFLVKKKQHPYVFVSSIQGIEKLPKTLKLRLRHLPFWCRLVSLFLLILILARPRTHTSWNRTEGEGIDIMMVMDISTSMLCNDVKPNRIEAAKHVAYEFINNRPNDNIGLTLFGGEAFIKCPLTTDHVTLLKMFQTVSCDLSSRNVIENGTAIGMGIASGINHLAKSGAKSKVIILLTDGENNAGEISPMVAAEMAKKSGVRVYTILLGKQAASNVSVSTLANGESYMVQYDEMVNPSVLKDIARKTGGIYYQADSQQKLQTIYDDIDHLEKTKLKVLNGNTYYEVYQPLALLLLFFLILEILLRTLWLRRYP